MHIIKIIFVVVLCLPLLYLCILLLTRLTDQVLKKNRKV